MHSRSINHIVERLRHMVLTRDGDALTDIELLECFIARHEEAAFEAIVRRHGSMVWGVCRRVLRNAADADDAFQATFLILARKAASIRSRELLANWLYGVAYHTALKARIASVKRQAREQPMNEMLEPATASQESLYDWQPVLDQELHALPDNYRIPILLCDLEGRTRKDAAQQLGVPEGTLNSRLARGRMLLAKRLTRHGITLSGGAIATVLSQHAASACLPATLMGSTVKAATLVAAGKTVAAGLVSATVITLTDGALNTMLLKKIMTTTIVVLVLSVASFVGILTSTHAGNAGDVREKQLVESGLDGDASQPKAPQQPDKKADQKAFTAWGKEIDGLQAGLHISNVDDVRIGGKVTAVVKLRNVGKDTRTISAFAIYPRVVDALDKRVRSTTAPASRFEYLPFDLTVKPGQTIYVDKADIHFVAPEDKVEAPEGVVYFLAIHVQPGKYKVDCTGFLKDIPDLATGMVEFDVKPGEDVPATAWGKEVGGLQAGLGFRPGQKRAYSHGETIKLVVRVRNVGKETVKFSYLMPYIEHAPIVTDAKGKVVHQPTKLHEIGERIPAEVELPPGKEVELHELHRDLKPASESGSNQPRPISRPHALYGTGKVHVQYEHALGDPEMGHPGWKLDAMLGKLATGKLLIEITSDPPRDAPEKKTPQTPGDPDSDKKMATSDWGPEDAGLRCRATANTDIEQGMPLAVSVEMQSVLKGPRPNVKQLDAFLVAEFMELTLTNVKTRKSVRVRPYDPTAGMLASDTGKYGIPLDGTKIKPWPISFPLVKLGADLVPGAYECKVRFSFPQRSKFWRGTDAAWDSAGFWHGAVESGTFRVEILKEQPKTKTFLLPKQLRLEKGLTINYTKEDAEAVELKLRNGHFVSARYLHYNDKKAVGMTMTGVPKPGDVNPISSISDYKGGDRNVSVTIEIFETADPPVHLWNPGPGSGGYKVLWSRTFDLRLTEKAILQKQ